MSIQIPPEVFFRRLQLKKARVDTMAVALLLVELVLAPELIAFLKAIAPAIADRLLCRVLTDLEQPGDEAAARLIRLAVI